MRGWFVHEGSKFIYSDNRIRKGTVNEHAGA